MILLSSLAQISHGSRYQSLVEVMSQYDPYVHFQNSVN